MQWILNIPQPWNFGITHRWYAYRNRVPNETIIENKVKIIKDDKNIFFAQALSSTDLKPFTPDPSQ